MTTFVLGALFPIHDFTFTISDWTFGIEEHSNYPPRTSIYLGPTSFDIWDVTAFQIIGVAGLAVAVLIALTVFLATHRRASQSSR